MLAGMILSLAGQQRRLLAGNRISFSKDSDCVRLYASTEPSSRRRRRRTGSVGQQSRDQGRAGSSNSGPSQQQAGSSMPLKDAATTHRLSKMDLHPAERDLMAHKHRKASASRSAPDTAPEFVAHRTASQPRRRSSGHTTPADAEVDGALSSGSVSSSIVTTPVSTPSSSCYGAGGSSSSSSSSSAGGGSKGGSSDQRSVLSEAGSRGLPQASSSRGFLLTEEDEAIIAATNRIARFMDFRERCAAEVLAKLDELGYEQRLAQKVLQRMQATGLQDDARFAEMYARGQWRAKTQAPERIAYELRMRRVSQRHIDAALAAVFGDSRQLAGREPSDEQQQASWEQLVEVCRQRVELTMGYPQQKRRAKLATWLQRRGHSLATAFRMFELLGI